MGRILVVEDSPDIASALEIALTMEGHHVVVASDGAAGLRLARALPLPDLLLVDLLLPGLCGRDLVEAVAADPDLRSVPIILITATARPDRFPRPETYRTLLRKPFDLEDLLTAVADALPTGESGNAATR